MQDDGGDGGTRRHGCSTVSIADNGRLPGPVCEVLWAGIRPVYWSAVEAKTQARVAAGDPVARLNVMADTINALRWPLSFMVEFCTPLRGQMPS